MYPRYCRKWEAENDEPFFAAAAERAEPDSVWRAAMRAEAAVETGKNAVVVTQDMKTFFQTIDHEKTREESTGHGVPNAITQARAGSVHSCQMAIHKKPGGGASRSRTS